MKSITFHCETITPMFLAGADGRTPELRPPSIKGALRFWWRALNGHLTLAEMKKKESEIFGGGGTKATQSTFSIFSDSLNMQIAERAFVPHKAFMKQKAFIEKQKFTVKLIFKEEKKIEIIKNLFIITSFLGGFGKRVRRGMGSFKIIKIHINDKNQNETFNYDLESLYSYIKHVTMFFNLSNNQITNTFSGQAERYPYIRTIRMSKRFNNDILFRISNATHDTKKDVGYQNYEPNLGYARGGRFASPIYVSVVEGNYAIVTELATFPKRGTEFLSFDIQEQFIDKIL